MLDRLREEIKLCFVCAEVEDTATDGKYDVFSSNQFKAAAVLIRAYNALVRLYFMPEYVDEYLLGSVEQVYKLHQKMNL